MIYYFAYGNNMHPETINERCLTNQKGGGIVKDIGVARIKDHRLAFTIKTPIWGGPVGDIISQPFFYVYGYLYQIDEVALNHLDIAEYLPEGNSYTRVEMQVEVVKKENLLQVDSVITAITYRVIEEKRMPEEPPQKDYIKRLIDGAIERNLPSQYVTSLKLMDVHANGDFIKGEFIGLPTKNRNSDYRMPIIQLSQENIKRLSIKEYAFITHGEKSAIAKVSVDNSLNGKGKVCRLDESIRRGLGFMQGDTGIEFYGGYLKITPAPNSARPKQIIPPRFLLLRMAKVDYIDCEKRIAVLDENLMSILGIEKGDYIQINAVIHNKNTNTLKTTKIRRRAFTGSTQYRKEGGELRPYPEEGVVHLDLDAREELGFDKYLEFYPLFVSASTKDLLLSRFVFYILVIVGVLVGIQQSVAPIFVSFIQNPDKTTKEIYGLLFSTFTSIIIGGAIAWNDVSRKVKP